LPPPSKFDSYAERYEEVLNESVKVSGETARYFAEVKADYLRRRYRPEFAGKVLDYGCGVGLLSWALSQSFSRARLQGFDPSAESIAHVPPELAAAGSFTSSIAELDRDYDLIVIANVMHHVPPPQRESLLGELGSRLAPNGEVAVFEHNPLNPGTRWSVAHCPFDDDAILLWPAELRGYLRRVGLHPLKTDYIVFFPRVLAAMRRLELHLSWCPAGAQYCVTARKQ